MSVAQQMTLACRTKDTIALTKPRITLMVILTAAAGMRLAPGSTTWPYVLLSLFSIAALVSAANVLNCWLEADVDRLMKRTRNRPLPSGRLDPFFALTLGLILSVGSVASLTWFVNPLTGLLGAISLFLYVGVYTPLKQKTPFALIIGAVPGAMPPLLGWTAETGSLSLTSLALFGTLFLWQIPHFIAISLFRKEEYAKAGIKTYPTSSGLVTTKCIATTYAAAMLPVSFLPFVWGDAGPAYFLVAFAGGAAYLLWSAYGFFAPSVERWAKQLFALSIMYLTVLYPVLVAGV